MAWWLIPAAIVIAAVLRLIWVAAFHPRERVAAMPELEGYIPGDRSTEPLSATAIDDRQSQGGDGGMEAMDAPENESEADEDGGVWIELDVEPLFPSSERSVIDLTGERAPESRP